MSMRQSASLSGFHEGIEFDIYIVEDEHNWCIDVCWGSVWDIDYMSKDYTIEDIIEKIRRDFPDAKEN